MVKVKEDLTGKRFGRLVVIKRAEDYMAPNNLKIAQWLCKCDCGGEIIVRGASLTRTKNATKSCGCIQKEVVSKQRKKYNTYDLSGEYGIGYTSKGEEFYFDIEDYDKIKDYCWFIDNDGYVIAHDSKANHSTKGMHRILFPNSKYVDHIKHKNNDNRKSQLRPCTNQQNNMNKGLQKNNTSSVAGVYFDKRRNKWCSQMHLNGEHIHLGYFDIFEDAVKVRKKAEEKYFGEYSYDNSMKGENVDVVYLS